MAYPFVDPLTSITNGTLSVGATTTVLLAENLDRKWAVFVNDSDEVIYLGFGTAAVLNTGLRLNAAGGTFEMTTFNCYQGAINAICTSGTKNLAYMEGT